jgi:hypothetical protein
MPISFGPAANKRSKVLIDFGLIHEDEPIELPGKREVGLCDAPNSAQCPPVMEKSAALVPPPEVQVIPQSDPGSD